ncbi:MAG: ribosome biogenesis GTPase Der [Myxococcota bacterium]|nr:ribosome biogenesis GTPase Der [Myxococcota bacterium]
MRLPAPLPIVAIVGRPNVGKSRLFNRYAGHRRALVRDEPGVTRDRIAEEVALLGKRFLLVDTAGLEPADHPGLEAQVQAQARTAVDEADAILFVVDGQAGLLPEDEEIARTLRKSDKPLALAVNKIDLPEHETRLADFYGLGFDDIYAVSAEHGGGAFDALEALVGRLDNAPLEEDGDPESRLLPLLAEGMSEIPDYSAVPLDHDFGGAKQTESPAPADEAETRDIRVALVGRPNVGKSSLTNRLIGEERVVVSDVPGTTRDSIDSRIEHDGQGYVLIDTAGLRRPGRRAETVEQVSALLTVRALERADVALLLVDAHEGISDQDAHVASLVRDRGCASVVVANKWDLVDGEKGAETLDAIRHGLRFMRDSPVLPLSALTGARLRKLFPAIRRAAAAGRQRISTAELNRWLQEVTRSNPPAFGRRSGHARRPIKFFYAAQTGVRPPTFQLVCTQPKAVQTAYRRYLENRLRERFGFNATPVRIQLRARGGKSRH